MSYWAKQQDSTHGLDTIQIVELIRERVMFETWPEQSRRILALAIYPEQMQDTGGQWTDEGRAALNLLRHLFKRGHFIRAPEALRTLYQSLDNQAKAYLSPRAAVVRHELLNLVPPWIMDSLV